MITTDLETVSNVNSDDIAAPQEKAKRGRKKSTQSKTSKKERR
jgi:hypothetical protein